MDQKPNLFPESANIETAPPPRAAVTVEEAVCKFSCRSVMHLQNSSPDKEISQRVQLYTLYDPNLDEDRRFAKATPDGSMEMLVTNKNLDGFFQPGAKYLITIRRADD